MNLIWIISMGLLLAYILRILSYRYGWRRVTGNPADGEECPGITLVIPVRDEEGTIGPLLSDLAGQDYPEERLEIILVDDHSGDKTPEIIRSFCSVHPGFRFMALNASESGKKAALEKGIRVARHRLILNTDGDCRVPSKWVRQMVAGFSGPQVRMVAGAVIYEPDRGIFHAMQSLESFSLTAVSGGSAGLDNPVLCSAANLAYYREDYLRFTGEHEKVSESGDDVFLMLWLKRKFPGSVRFSTSPGAAIRTRPVPDLPSFFRQRMRWSSKALHYHDANAVGTAMLVLALNLLLLALLTALLALLLTPPLARILNSVPGLVPGDTWKSGLIPGVAWKPGLLRLFGVILLGKSLADLLLLVPVLRHYGKMRLLLYFLPLQMIYFMYVSLAGVLGQFLSLSWKGRKVRVHRRSKIVENKS
jgi:biofilm PGA synthesis N-glycosyltransferase PgaC